LSAVLELRDIHAGYGARPILSGVSLSVAEGEFLCVCGGSGGGKSTLLRVAAGLLAPTLGSVTFCGAPVDGPPRGLQVVFQQYTDSLFPWLTVRGNILLALGGAGLHGDEAASRARDALAMVRLTAHAETLPRALSGGMAQRAALARALAVRPRVLCMDEPFGALDASTRRALQDELLSLPSRPTIVFVTHDIDEALYLSDRVVVVGGGTVHELRPGLPRPRDQVETPALPGFHVARRALFGMIS
jgi:NitT/TauT family transport system ATP-binding protein